jgi:TRAP-type mannitol/chloroaromatic compound transport system permease large subunit
MIAFFSAYLAPIMFLALVFFLLSGFPVAFSLAACGFLFGFIGIELGLLPATLFQALPLRVFGIMQNETLLAIPFFTLMGLILERSGMAEDLLDTVGQVFGPVRGGLALAVIFVGALLAATTGVVAASVISMGLISLPIMLRYGYHRSIACGVITASGTLAQAIPPSLVLIIMADQLGKSVGDMYRGAFIPALMLVGLYALFVMALAIFKPHWVPALPPEARMAKEPNGKTGLQSLWVLCALTTLITVVFAGHYTEIRAFALGREAIGPAPLDETIVMALSAGTALAFTLALLDKLLKLNWLSGLARRVTFVLIPPLALIFLVLGTIFLGLATPTEGGAMGAMGALLMAASRKRMSFALLRQSLEGTTRLSCFVLFILIGSTVFSFTFTAIDGHIWVEHLFDQLPGGPLGFLIFVNLMVFGLGFFLDFFEIAFILIPLLAPVAENMGIDLIWFGIIIAINLQTSFLTPPFGFALFYLRSVAPVAAFLDRQTQKRTEGVTTAQIYRGSIPFVLIQICMIGVLIAFPGLVTGRLAAPVEVDLDSIHIPIHTGSDWGDAPTAPRWGDPSPTDQKPEPPLEGPRPW